MIVWTIFDFLRKMLLTEKEIVDCMTVLRDWYHIDLTSKQVYELLIPHKDVQKSIRYFGAFDTAERENLADIVSETVGAGSWPCNGENRFNEFWEDFSTKARSYGYSILTL